MERIKKNVRKLILSNLLILMRCESHENYASVYYLEYARKLAEEV